MDIKSAVDHINFHIAQIRLDRKPSELYDPVKYMMGLGGKRMRPLLALLGTYLFDNDYSKTIQPAIAIELFHNFTLIHDDIMDEAPLRRGQPTVHQKWNHNTALLSGDVTLIEAYELLEFVPESIRLEVFKLFNLTAKQVCEGQQMDMNFESRQEVSIDDYIEMIHLKTAVLLGFSMYMGARMGGASQEQAHQLYEVANNIGIAFQIKDDYLDVYGDAEKFGKQVGGDILAQKKTYLLLSAFVMADAEQKSRLRSVMSTNIFSSHEKIYEVINIYNQLDIRTIAYQAIYKYFDKALFLLSQLDADEKKKVFLSNYFRELMERDT